MEIPRYVRCHQVWSGTHRSTKEGELFDTNIPNDFSCDDWEAMYSGGSTSNGKDYFTEITEQEYKKEKGIPFVVNTYSIF